MNKVTLTDLQKHCWNYVIQKDNSDNGLFLNLDEEEFGTLSQLFVIGEVINFMGVEMRCTQSYANDFDLGYRRVDIYLEDPDNE